MTREDENIQEAAEAGGVQSVEIGIDVLRPLVAAGRPVPLKMVTAATGLPRAKVHRYLVSLVRSGLAWQEPGTGYYGLGSFAVQVGLAALGTLDRDALGRQAIRELRDELNLTACLCVWSDGPTIIAVEPAEGQLFVGLRTGSRLSLTRSASGRVFMAHLPHKTWRQCVPPEDGSRFDLAAVRQTVHDASMAGVSDLVMVGMSGLAAPVFNHTGTISATLTLVGPTGSFDAALGAPPAKALRARANALSAQLGYLPSRVR